MVKVVIEVRLEGSESLRPPRAGEGWEWLIRSPEGVIIRRHKGWPWGSKAQAKKAAKAVAVAFGFEIMKGHKAQPEQAYQEALAARRIAA